jgi:hypothetical protein
MAGTWKVTAQRASTVLNAAGDFEPAMKISYETAKGVRDNIWVPKSQYNPANVHKLITANATIADEVHGLTGEASPSSESEHSSH